MERLEERLLLAVATPTPADVATPLAIGEPLVGAARTDPAAAYGTTLPISARAQWDDNNGYCGETCVQTFALYYGTYVSQYQVRAMIDPTQRQDLLLETTPGVLDSLRLTYQQWDEQSQPTPQYQGYLAWTKQQLSAGHPVIGAVYVNGSSDPYYDHIIPFVGFESAHDATAYHADDSLVFYDNYERSSFNRVFSNLVATRSGANSGPYDYYIPTGTDFGCSITGILDPNHETLPVRLAVDRWDEPNLIRGQSPVSMHGTLTITSLIPGRTYTLLRYDDFRQVPASGFLATGGYTSSRTFTASAASATLADDFLSSSCVTYRCVDSSPSVSAGFTPGLYDPAASMFYLRGANTSGPANSTFGFGQPGGSYQTLVGDWDGNGLTGVGLYDPASSTFYLTDAFTSGYAQYTFGYGQPGQGWMPLVGDWDGDGRSGVGLYDPHASTFYLTNSLQTGVAQYTFGYGQPGANWTPLVGDWNADHAAGVGLYDPLGSLFYLTSTLRTGVAEHTFGYGAAGAGWQPMVGDWNGDGSAGVGLFDGSASRFYLTNAFTSGVAQYSFAYGQSGSAWKPLVGDWDGNGSAGVGLYNPTSSIFYLTDTLTTGVAQYTIAFGTPGLNLQPLIGHWYSTPARPSLHPAAVDSIDLAALSAEELRAPQFSSM